ncbi:hypothetical protein P5G65_23375 [Paenibacillus chondroitinus]|uniref:Lipoprotein n=1 Tax=Paenibacillus chondroitinus TaxID=59842 RepID=A0ABU6DIN3_9BACL|nr:MULTISPECIES: hypothetical protein [Paenibacillus]MCY9659453.1 hypothetical protein [Paenibacillus anseongense]MEB4796848.1 hypothetical protein [Paenibacillus chondroitinus]
MGHYRFVVLFLILLIFLVSCNQQANTMLVKMPDDFNFSVRYGITSKNEINTFESTVTKDLVSNGIITTSIKLSENEMTKIYKQMREVNISQDLKLVSKSNCRRTPYSEDQWKIQMNGKITSFIWSEENCVITHDAKKLEDLRKFVFNIVKNKTEYKKLPEAVGGYD